MMIAARLELYLSVTLVINISIFFHDILSIFFHPRMQSVLNKWS